MQPGMRGIRANVLQDSRSNALPRRSTSRGKRVGMGAGERMIDARVLLGLSRRNAERSGDLVKDRRVVCEVLLRATLRHDVRDPLINHNHLLELQ